MALSAAELAVLSRLLDEALELDAAGQARWLETLPPQHAALVPVLREMLARTHQPSGLMLDRPPRLSERSKPAAAEPEQEHAGELVGPYRLIRELGHGGMGTVWLAERADGSLKRQVALKLPRLGWGASLGERMRRERDILAVLEHPNIARLYDAGLDARGRPYLALEYVEGEPIDKYCRAQALTVLARVQLFQQVARAVAHAHARLIVHRDLKPSNILVAGDGTVRLLDFGIAKLLEADAPQDKQLTALAGRVLTPDYASPEQLKGERITVASDVYSLGVLLYELLTGMRPARRTTGASLTIPDFEEARLASQVTTDLTARRLLRGDLDTILRKALKTDPDLRYASVEALAADIERHLAGDPVLAQPDSTSYRLAKFVRRHRVGVAATSAIVTAVVVGAGVSLWQATQAREQAARATMINDFVLSVIQQADPAASQQTRAADIALLTAAERRVAPELGARADVALQIRMAIATAYRNRGDFEHARTTLRSAFDDASKTLSADNLDLLRARIQLVEWPLVDVATAQADLDAAVATLRALGKPAAPVLIDALLIRGKLRIEIADWESARTDGAEALKLARQHLDPGNPRILEAALEQSRLLDNLKASIAVIEPVFRAAKEQGHLSPGNPTLLEAQTTYGWALVMDGRPQDGMPLLRNAVELARSHHGNDSSAAERALEGLARGLAYGGNLQDAIGAFREAYSIAAVREPPASLHRGQRAQDLAAALAIARKPQEASHFLEEATASTRLLPEGRLRDGREAEQQWRWVRLYVELGRQEQAVHLARELTAKVGKNGFGGLALVIRPTVVEALLRNGDTRGAATLAETTLLERRAANPGDDHSLLLGLLAMCKLAQDTPRDAMALADEAIAVRLRFQRAPRPFDADLQITRGRALLALDRAAEAREALQKADAFWRDFDADNPWAAEASWRFGQALVATGDVAQGRKMLAQARPRLASSWIGAHRALVDVPVDR